MAGKHSRTRMFSSPAGIAATAAVATALAVGGTVGAGRLAASSDDDAAPAVAVTTSAPSSAAATPASPAPALTSPPATPTTAASPSPTATRSPQAASRGSARKAAPKPTATRKAAPKPAAPTVVSSGTCGASFYQEGQLTANGESFNPEALTAAHRTLPFDTRVRVTNPATGASVTVRINDRGPFIDGRCIDLSRAAFRAIAALDLGEVSVRYEVLG